MGNPVDDVRKRPVPAAEVLLAPAISARADHRRFLSLPAPIVTGCLVIPAAIKNVPPALSTSTVTGATAL